MIINTRQCYLFFVLLFSSISLLAQSNWTKRNPQPGTLDYSFIHFQDTSKGTLYTRKNVNAVTINGGKYWSYQNSQFPKDTGNNQLTNVYFASPLVGFAVLANDTLRKTTNGGENWNKIGNATSVGEIYFSNELEGLAVKHGPSNNQASYLNTTNGGTSWTQSQTTNVYRSLSRRVPGEYWSVEDFWSSTGVYNTKAYKTTDNGNSWQGVEVGAAKYLTTTYFLNSNIGWIAGDSGFVARTVDGGQTWQSGYNTFGQSDLRGVFIKKMKFFTPSIGFALTTSGFIFKTTDGGVTWVNTFGSNSGYYSDFQFLDENIGWGIGYQGTLFKTINGGVTWQNQVKGIQSFFLEGVLNGSRAWLVGLDGSAYWSNDKGITWNQSDLTNTNNKAATDILFTNNQTGFVAKGGILKTTNNGFTWDPTPIGFSGVSDLKFPVPDTGYAVNDRRGFARTFDAGLTWQTMIPPVDTGSVNFYHEVQFPSPKIGYRTFSSTNDPAGSPIFKTTDAGSTWSNITSNIVTPPSIITVLSMFFLDPLQGWVSHINTFNNQNILMLSSTSDGGVTWNSHSIDKPYFDFHFTTSSIGYSLHLNELYQTLDGGFTWNSIGGVGESQHSGIIFQGDNPVVLFGQGGQIMTSDAWAGELTFVASGRVVKKENSDCIQDANEMRLANRILKAEPGPFFGSTNKYGKYDIRLEPGTYTISQQNTSLLQAQLESQFCPSSNSISLVVNTLLDTIPGNNFINDGKSCPILVINQNHSRMRPCRVGSLLISIQNQGNVPSDSEEVHIKLPVQLYLKSSLPVVQFSSSDSTYRLKIKPLQPNELFTITIIDSVQCDPNGLQDRVLCVKTVIPNAPACLLQSPNWNGTNLEVASKCLLTGQTRFNIRNSGNSMPATSQYQIFIDTALVYQAPFQLAANGSLSVTLPPNAPSGFARMVVPQSANHPLSTFASAEANCSTGLSTNGLFPPPDESPLVDFECVTVTNAYDPNDKTVYPKGWGTAGNVEPETEFTYKIRFQNTGTDTAFKVVLVDTLDEDLDIASIQIGAASHPFTFKVSGKGRPVFTWTFDNILLPDSNTNQLASNGFVSYSIRPKAGLAFGTRLENFADIYFDFNDPIRTNTTVNTLWQPSYTPGILDTVFVTATKKPLAESSLSIFPNPTKGKVNLVTSTLATACVFNSNGVMVLSRNLETGAHEIDLSSLSKGLYLIRLDGDGGKQQTKIVLE